jgi:hypothetical protein
MNIPTLEKWTPSMEHQLKCMWGIEPLNDILKELNISKEELFKKVKSMKINRGKDKSWSLDELNALSKIMAETNNFIPDIMRVFSYKSMIGVYENIEAFKDLNKSKIKKKRWLKKENDIIIDYILTNGCEKELLKILCRHNKVEIQNQISKLSKKIDNKSDKILLDLRELLKDNNIIITIEIKNK